MKKLTESEKEQLIAECLETPQGKAAFIVGFTRDKQLCPECKGAAFKGANLCPYCNNTGITNKEKTQISDYNMTRTN